MRRPPAARPDAAFPVPVARRAPSRPAGTDPAVHAGAVPGVGVDLSGDRLCAGELSAVPAGGIAVLRGRRADVRVPALARSRAAYAAAVAQCRRHRSAAAGDGQRAGVLRGGARELRDRRGRGVEHAAVRRRLRRAVRQLAVGARGSRPDGRLCRGHRAQPWGAGCPGNGSAPSRCSSRRRRGRSGPCGAGARTCRLVR